MSTFFVLDDEKWQRFVRGAAHCVCVCVFLLRKSTYKIYVRVQKREATHKTFSEVMTSSIVKWKLHLFDYYNKHEFILID